MWKQFAGNGLFVFSDPAGAKACLAIDEILSKEHVKGKRRLISNKKYSFYDQFIGNVEITDNDSIKQIMENMERPDFIFTGTSHPESSNGFELKFLREANTKSYSFVDHWTNFKLRFMYNDELILPDKIFVLDDKAKILATADGLPEEKISLLPNPYITLLKEFASPAISKNSFLARLGIVSGRKIVLYAPDPVSIRSYSGKNELDVLEELLELSKDNFILLLKLHPLQPLEKIEHMIVKRKDVRIITDNEFLPVDIFKNVDCIVGFYSNYLMEASSLNSSIIRYMIDPNMPDYLEHALKSTLVNNKMELDNAINKESA